MIFPCFLLLWPGLKFKVIHQNIIKKTYIETLHLSVQTVIGNYNRHPAASTNNSDTKINRYARSVALFFSNPLFQALFVLLMGDLLPTSNCFFLRQLFSTSLARLGSWQLAEHRKDRKWAGEQAKAGELEARKLASDELAKLARLRALLVTQCLTSCGIVQQGAIIIKFYTSLTSSSRRRDCIGRQHLLLLPLLLF